MNADTPELNTLIAEATRLHETGRLDEAARVYRAALAQTPQHPAIMHNLGAIAASQGDYKAAIGCFDAALALRPSYIAAHLHRAMAQQALGNSPEAIKSYGFVCQLDPAHYGAHRALGFLWLAEGQRGRSLDHFARTYELRRGEDRTNIAVKSMTQATRDKLQHDAEQFRFLAERGRSQTRFTDLAQRYGTIAKNFSTEPSELSGQQIGELGPDYNGPINRYDAPERTDQTLAERADRDLIIKAFEESHAAAAVLDDFLTPAALHSLRSYLLCSTVWHDFTHIPGFVASYLEDGLACPILLQIADEFRQAFPEILAGHPLSQAWAFKGLHGASTIGAHADDAWVSLNFWVTPDSANLQPGASGLSVCLEPPPDDWRMTDYGQDTNHSAHFMDQHESRLLKVPYRENRAVLFHSRLFHRSETPLFAEGYENHRINLTFLYGSPSHADPETGFSAMP
jgi:tetratricopeptide (TPR) repeat protein